ncbi:MAG TPA: alpha/beta fold hydrolase [Ktedonobacteraceae bacterium]|jgi:medium-chain acyl-[acyl-carrier-protein] hydrolase|nr:alpha/beta fold hydrolase [Ktedonobacteraceae bacterium]
MSTSLWVTHTNPQARLRLFCFPYAGGGASIFRLWKQHFPADIDICPVQLPGRENRLKEPPFVHLAPLVDAVAHEIAPLLDRPFALFGHSMGALISFELVRALRRQQEREPAYLFVSAHRAPQFPMSRDILHDLPAPAFLRSVYRMGGTPPAVLLNQELMRLMLPMLRADFTVNETYTYEEEPPLALPITAFGGEQDTLVSKRELQGWNAQTSNVFASRILPGDHFFLQSSREMLLAIIAQELAMLR